MHKNEYAEKQSAHVEATDKPARTASTGCGIPTAQRTATPNGYRRPAPYAQNPMSWEMPPSSIPPPLKPKQGWAQRPVERPRVGATSAHLLKASLAGKAQDSRQTVGSPRSRVNPAPPATSSTRPVRVAPSAFCFASLPRMRGCKSSCRS